MSLRRYVAAVALSVLGVVMLGVGIGWATADDAFGAQPYGACSETVSTASPAAGAQPVAFTVPSGHYWDVHTLRFVLTTSAVAGSRTVGSQIADASARILWRTTLSQGPNLTTGYVDFNGAPSSGATSNTGLPLRTLQPGDVISITVGGIDVADQISQVVLSYCDGTSATAPTINVGNFPSTSLPLPVTIDGGVTLDGDVTVSPVCSATTTTVPDDDERVSACVQRVKLDEASNIPLWIAIALGLVALGFIFAMRLIRGT